MTEQEIGKITQFFNKINVAVLSLSGELKIGDKIRVEANEPFIQTVNSMQIEHESIKKAKSGDEIGLKVDKPVKQGNKVFKVLN